MKRVHMRLFVLLAAVLMLSACAEKTPQETAEVFWTAVISNDVADAVKYSTLTDPREYDGFTRNWTGYQASWGKIIIEGDNASIDTVLTKIASSGEERLEFETILIRQEGKWKVDYARTGKEVSGGPFSKLFGELERVGKSLSAQLNSTSEQLSAEMDRMGEQLATLSQSIGDQATEIIEKQGEELRKNIEELAESARRALEEQEKSLSDKDRQTLREVVTDLEKGSDNLAEPTLQSIADGGKSVAAANHKLGGIDNEVLAPYKKQWQEWGERVEDDMRNFVDEVSATNR